MIKMNVTVTTEDGKSMNVDLCSICYYNGMSPLCNKLFDIEFRIKMRNENKSCVCNTGCQGCPVSGNCARECM